ncbi:helix-turn-helix domain-containing protein [Rossellomorea oryzaecorticis]|uniref:Helix-turn-helix domain-containing protein n=2 Tax=Rossellomorea oryzaecorticis TaxID=1396505 RepID=A0ABU9KAD1_9BACI
MEKITLNVKEVAQMLDLSEDFIYKLTREKKIPHVRIGSRILFKRHSIEEWLSQAEEQCI